MRHIPSVSHRITASALGIVPKRAFSDFVGFWARRQVPRRLRPAVFTAFARRVGARLDEVDGALEDYPTLGAFFARRLKPGVRPVDPRPGVVISPCDGTISQAGALESGRLLQAKGRDYSLVELLGGDEAQAAQFAGGCFATIYLSPRDYHRVHAPLAGHVTGYHRIPGRLFSVNPPSVECVDRLFSRNERLVTYLETALGPVAVVMVGAMGVGSIAMAYDPEARSRVRKEPERRNVYPAPLPVERGGELGTFHLGSTVILLFAPDRVKGVEGLAPGRIVRLGEALLETTRGSAREESA